MRIIIVGCGKVGTTLIEQLSREGHDITIIDRSAKLVQTLTDLYDVMGIVGNGASYMLKLPNLFPQDFRILMLPICAMTDISSVYDMDIISLPRKKI